MDDDWTNLLIGLPVDEAEQVAKVHGMRSFRVILTDGLPPDIEELSHFSTRVNVEVREGLVVRVDGFY